LTAMIELSWPQQLLLGTLTVLIAIWMQRSSTSYLVTMTLMLVSVFSTFRYGYWRVATTIRYFLEPGSTANSLDAFFIWLLLFAECYAFVILGLGYLQTLWPLRRVPVPLPEDADDWPAVDLLIPTFNEPLSVVRFTALAAMNIDWPADKLNVYILDDGNREEFRAFAEDAGIGYMTRDDHAHAKAGNINRALERLDAPYVAIFDSDHVPTRSFMQVTMGWFLRDRKLGMLQTPHHFYSPDPFERNLGQFRVIPNEGELFYGVVQDGNDFWNATFFCGSCAVLRRSALDEIGGIAVETVTEDAHTSLRMQMKGWNTAYINIPQAAGLATERLSGHVKQRIRWARGMIQILRTDNPLFAPGLSLAQRLCYFNAMTHFLYALPRMIFLTAPLIYLVLGRNNIPGYWAAILAYAFPHLALSSMVNSRIQGQHRHSFWNEIYETVLAPYIFLPTMIALVNPKLGSFNVTAKGGVLDRSFFDTRIAQPFLFMLIFNMIGLLMAIPKFFLINIWPLNLAYDRGRPGTIVMNVLWTLFNVMVLGVATAVAWESQQRRQTVRVAMNVPADVVFADGALVEGVTADLSSGGVMVHFVRGFTAIPGEQVKLVFPVLDGDAMLPATIVSADSSSLRARFDPLTLQEEEALTMLLYSRADTWLGWGEAREADRPLQSLGRILQLAVHGLLQTFQGTSKRKKRLRKRRMAAGAFPMLLFAAVAGGMVCVASGAQMQRLKTSVVRRTQVSHAANAIPAAVVEGDAGTHAVAPGNFDDVFKFTDVGVSEPIVLRGVDAYHSIQFWVPKTQVIKTATMHLRYQFSPGLIPALSHLKVSLNGRLFATLPVGAQPGGSAPLGDGNGLLEATLTMPAEVLARRNELTFEFIGHYTYECEDPAHSALWSHVHADSTIEFAGSLLPLQNDLSMLPLPFYDADVNLHPSIPIVFLSQPSPKALRAAGILTSYFGMLTDSRGAHFPVSIGTIPTGNAVVIGENAAELPASLNVTSSTGATIAMRTNPVDPYSKLLVLTGDSADDLVIAAEMLVLQRDMLHGDQQRGQLTKKIVERKPDDAPRWLSTEGVTYVGDLAGAGDLQSDGGVPVEVYFRLPPDLYLEGAQRNLSYHLSYRYNGIPLASDSSLQVSMNSAFVSSTPLPHTEKGSADIETIVPVPISDMRPFSNSLVHKFGFQVGRRARCQDIAPTSTQGAILKTSYLDIRGIPHWKILPDLEIFANAGYPFTRKADLADTAVVLPDVPTADELEMYLTLMGHFGAQTGYPVLNVSVTNDAGMGAGHNKDYIVLGTVDDQPTLTRLRDVLPVKIEDGEKLRIQDTQGFFAPLQHAWWKVRSSEHVQSGQLETAGGLPDALIEGLEWPAGSSRSVVVIALRDHRVAANFLNVFLKTSQSSDISQSVSVLHGARFSSYRIGNDVYRVGSLPPWTHSNMLFSQFPWLAVLSTIILCALMAVLIRAMLRRHARSRLQGNQ
jgi:cellulose synthase (UDP-forming)